MNENNKDRTLGTDVDTPQTLILYRLVKGLFPVTVECVCYKIPANSNLNVRPKNREKK